MRNQLVRYVKEKGVLPSLCFCFRRLSNRNLYAEIGAESRILSRLAPLSVIFLLNRKLISSATLVKGTDFGSVIQKRTRHQNVLWNWSYSKWGNPECWALWSTRKFLLGQQWIGNVAENCPTERRIEVYRKCWVIECTPAGTVNPRNDKLLSKDCRKPNI